MKSNTSAFFNWYIFCRLASFSVRCGVLDKRGCQYLSRPIHIPSLHFLEEEEKYASRKRIDRYIFLLNFNP